MPLLAAIVFANDGFVVADWNSICFAFPTGAISSAFCRTGRLGQNIGYGVQVFVKFCIKILIDLS